MSDKQHATAAIDLSAVARQWSWRANYNVDACDQAAPILCRWCGVNVRGRPRSMARFLASQFRQ